MLILNEGHSEAEEASNANVQHMSEENMEECVCNALIHSHFFFAGVSV